MVKEKENLAYMWSTDVQPHVVRCREIIQKYPQVQKLMGRNPWTFAILSGLVVLQFGIAFWLGGLGFQEYWWAAVILAYCVGAFANHTLYGVIHEATHNMIFKNRMANKLCCIMADLPNAVPGGIGFATFHLRHHAHMGDYEHDADLASDWEAKMVKNIWWRKAIWLSLFPVFQIIRTFRFTTINTWHKWMYINMAIVFASDIAIIYFFGFNAFFYLFISMLFALGLHPVGARWIQEHFTNDEGQETFSYYGPLNYLSLNLGYHNEHHDFPSIPWNNLPRLREIAPEYYVTNGWKYHMSWTGLLKDFIFNPEYSLYSRVRRED